jgi:hypothetical protein
MNTLTMMKKLSLATAGAALLGFGAASAAQAATIGTPTTVVVPNNLATTEGDASNGFPFNIGDPTIVNGGLASQRYQQVYAASEFDTLGGLELVITQILFRPDATFGKAFSSVLPDIQINLSTTSAAPNSMSTTFANNVGSDDKVVFSGPLSLSSANTGPAGGPKNFDIVINLMNPFRYNPSAGSLLLDVRNFGGGTTTLFDAQFPSTPTSRGYTLGANDVNASTGTVDSVGLVTAFKGTPIAGNPPGGHPGTSVPEPLTVGGTILAGGMGLLMKKKQAAFKKAKETAKV